MVNKLNNLQRNSKAYWSLLKCFLNNKKRPLIPQCSLINNGSILPTHMQYLTNSHLSSVTFSPDDIVKIIQNLDSGKRHGHDNISIRMLKICGSAIYEPLAIIFK